MRQLAIRLNFLASLFWMAIFSVSCSPNISTATSSQNQTSAASPVETESQTQSAEASAEVTSPIDDDPYQQKRDQMVTSTIESRGIVDPNVLRAMRDVKRHLFVPEKFIDQAYKDHPLPIGYGQTISQPYIVALMTDLLELEADEKVLEIGTGSGYQAAVLDELGYVEVYTIEIVPELASAARDRLHKLGYRQIKVKQDDGYYGWEEYAPFDAIIVTAAPDHLPAPLIGQLAEDGRLVIPIGPPGGYQTLWKFVSQEGELKAFNLGGVSFVPFTGEGIEQSEN